MGCVLFHSCDEEWDRWEMTTMEINSSIEDDEADIPYNPMTIQLDIVSNNEWSVIVPDWMSVDQASGKDSAQIQVSISENSTKKDRTGNIVVRAGNRETNGNVVGEITKSIKINQKSKYRSIELNIVSVEITKKIKNFYNSDYDGTITYEIKSDLGDTEIAGFVQNPMLYIEARGVRGDYPEPLLVVSETWKINLQDITKGQHTITFHKGSQYSELREANIYIEYQVSQNDKIKGEEFNYKYIESQK